MRFYAGRHTFVYATLLVVFGLVVAAVVTLVGTQDVQAQVRWPLEVTYRVESQLHPRLDSDLMIEERAFRGTGWSEWIDVQERNIRNSPASCHILYSDGSLWEGVGQVDESSVLPCEAQSLLRKGEPSEGGAPNAWLNARTEAQYLSLGFEEVKPQRALTVAESLNLSSDDLVELQSGGERRCSDLGYEDCAADGGSTEMQTQTIVLYKPLGIPLLNEELFGDVVLTRYQALSFNVLDEYVAPPQPGA